MQTESSDYLVSYLCLAGYSRADSQQVGMQAVPLTDVIHLRPMSHARTANTPLLYPAPWMASIGG